MKAVIIHTDTLSNYLCREEYCFTKSNKHFHVDLPGLKKAEVKIIIMAVFVKPEFKSGSSFKKTLNLIDEAYLLLQNTEELELIRNYDDFLKIKDNDKIGVMLALEGGDTIFNLSALRIYYYLGIRMISLTWNNRNHLADGTGEFCSKGGVSQFGKDVIKEMEKNKIILDVSHLSETSFWDVVKHTKKPIIASHSNVKSICRHPRNLNDEQIKAIASSGGLIGINFYPPFLKKSGRTEIKNIIRHINYIRTLVGCEHIVLGTDFDGIDCVPDGLENAGKLPALSSALRNSGYENNEVKKIFHENFLRFLKKYWS